MKKIIILLLIAPLFVFAQRREGGRPRQKVENIFHDREFWKTQPDVATVKQKIKEGNDAEKSNRAAFDAVSYAITAKAPIKTIEFLLSLPGNNINKSTHDGRSYLMWAGYAGDIDVMKLLLSKGADTKVVGSHGFNWFTFTLNAGHENTDVYDLMEANGVDLKGANRSGANAILLMAQTTKDGKIIKYFESKGLSTRSEDEKGNNILFYAAKKGNVDLMKKYVAQGFDYQKINKDGENLVLYASKGSRGHSNSVEVYKYLESLGLDLNQVNKKGQTALHLVARSTKHVEVLDFFIKHKVDLLQKDIDGNTAFLNAVEGNNTLVVNKILESVDDINQQNKEGFSAAVLATKHINLELFKILIEKGADVNVVDNKGNNLFYHLFEAYSRRNAKDFNPFADELLTSGVSTKVVSKNETLLHIAIAKGEQKLIKKAFDLGVEINQKNSDGLTPLHLAAMKASNIRLLKMLLKKGADKSAVTDFEESAYDLASENELLKNENIDFLKI